LHPTACGQECVCASPIRARARAHARTYVFRARIRATRDIRGEAPDGMADRVAEFFPRRKRRVPRFFPSATFVGAATRVGLVFFFGVARIRRDNKLLADGLAFLDLLFFLSNRNEIDDEVTDAVGKYFATMSANTAITANLLRGKKYLVFQFCYCSSLQLALTTLYL